MLSKNNLKKELAALVVTSMVVGNMSMLYAYENLDATNADIENREINQSTSQNNIESENNDVDEQNQNEDTSSKNVEIETKVVGQNTFVDENGTINTVDVYDGTTGEEYNPYTRMVNTAYMVNFNCSKSKSSTISFTDYYTGQAGYLFNGTTDSQRKEMVADAAFLGMADNNTKVKFMLSGVTGLIDASLVEIVPQGSYYASNYRVNSNGQLYHYISTNVNDTVNTNTNRNYIGTAPNYFIKNKEYYSYDGHYFYESYDVMINDYINETRRNSVNPDSPYYSYYQYLPFRSKTNYTATELNTIINKKANSPQSKMNNIGESLIKYQNVYGVNALMMSAFAAQESGWGKSSISIQKNNLFGIGAFDSDPFNRAHSFNTVDDCLKEFASGIMSRGYLRPEYSNFRGGFFGDKASGFSQYASDPYRGEKCAAIASIMDRDLSSKDNNYYTIGIKDSDLLTHTKVEVKKESNVQSTTLYTTVLNAPYSFIIRNTNSKNGYYQVQTDASLSDNRSNVVDDSEYYYDRNYGYVDSSNLFIVNKGSYIFNQIPVISDVKVTNVTTEGYTVTCKVNDPDGKVTRVEFPTWTLANGQDDITWQQGKIEGDTATFEVKVTDHRGESGAYQTHIYAYDDAGAQTSIAAPTVNVPEAGMPVITGGSASNVTRKGYTVTVTVESDSRITRAGLYVWTEKNGQDDLKWKEASVKNNGNGKYTVTCEVEASEHNNESGVYNTHVYVYSAAGKQTSYAIEQVNIENDIPIITDAKCRIIDSDQFEITCKATDFSNVTSGQIATWTESGGQDDIVWTPVDVINGEIKIVLNRFDHNFQYGKYINHIYVYDDEGAHTSIATNVIELEEPSYVGARPVIKNVYFTNVNDEGYTINCEVIGENGISSVKMPSWTYKNGQDDLQWHEASFIGNNTYSCRIYRSQHKYEFGAYQTHIYAYANNGQLISYALPMVNILNTTSSKGWTYINGQKYFFDNNGNVAGNMPSKKVIDVSVYNGNIDWATVKNYGEVDGAILRIAAHPNGSYIEDAQFANNLRGCLKYNIPFGVYIYDYSNNQNDAYNEANFVINILRKYNVSPSMMAYPIFFDMERDKMSTEQNVLNAQSFLNQVRNNGFSASIYSYRSLLNGLLNHPYIWSQVGWMAAYTNTIGWSNPYYHGNFGWQYTSGGSVPGINGYVDISCWYDI